MKKWKKKEHNIKLDKLKIELHDKIIFETHKFLYKSINAFFLLLLLLERSKKLKKII